MAISALDEFEADEKLFSQGNEFLKITTFD